MLGASFKRTIFIAIFFSSAVNAASNIYLDPSRILYDRPDAATQLELIECFRSGACEHDDKIRIYPMPCTGSGTADCTGCYRIQGGSPSRIGDLNSNGSCAGVGQADEQLLRVFVGYERKCPGATTAGTTCTDGQLLLSCSITSEGTATMTDALAGYNKDCFAGRAFIRQVQASVPTVTVLPSPVPPIISSPTGDPGCAAGTTGTYPSCVPCSDTSYKPTTGGNACTQCIPPVIEHSVSASTSTAGTTKTSVNDCRTTFTCEAGYIANPTARTCDLLPVSSPAAIPSSSPVPSPTPSASYTPTCVDAMMTLTVRGTEPYGTSGNDYRLSFLQTWNQSAMLAGVDYRAVVFNKLDGTYINATKAGVIQGIAESSFTPVKPGNYKAITFYSVQGVRCPQSAPIYFTVPVAGGG